MFLSETIVRAIQSDRERDLERASRERRLLQAPELPVSTALTPLARPVTPVAAAARRGRTGAAA